MAFFKDSTPPARETPPPAIDPPVRAPEREHAADIPRRPIERTETRVEAPTAPKAEPKESFISAELALEGKIAGVGHVRIAGKFKGDVDVQGDLTIERGAHVAGQVKARQVVIEGALEGNISGAERVELRQTGVLTGDVKAGQLIVAAGSKMRGQVEFGWDEKTVAPVATARAG
jgi:cytoskeletal protein CcmA (bactofilin family)